MANRVFLSILFIFFLPTIASAINVLKNIEIKDDTLLLYFDKNLNKKDFKANAITKKGITKYFFDFKNCYLGNGVKRVTKLKGDIKSVRVAQYKPKVVRVVIDSKKSYKVKYYQKSKPIFYISLPKGIKVSKNKKSKEKISPKKLFVNVDKNDDSKEIKDVPKAEKKSHLSKLKNNYTIIIDAGHGGKDPGAKIARVREKDIVLSVAKRVYRKLRTYGFKVKYTRASNKYLTLGSRTRKANRYNADLFVSIHANSIENKARREKVYGIETYFLSQARTQKAKRIAARENASLLKEMDGTSQEVLLNTVFTGPKIVLSNKLAIDVQKGILNSLRNSYKGIKDNGVRGAPFYVLVGAQMPAVLVEIGYLSNSKERKRIKTAKYQEKVADGIVKGIISYFKNREREME